ncbi:MAG: DUF1616 domain-containing protein [Ktedonobacteraceae bacterium]|nr:DUF1616 domain-containing protein [Ktedonobacteraceae bacterium]
MRLKNIDLGLALTISIASILCVLIPNPLPWLRTVLALPLIFVLPGYLLTELLFYWRKIAPSHRLLLSLGLSIVIVILSGLLLNILASGLQSVSWAACLSSITLLEIIVVAVRRGRIAGSEIKIKMLNVYEYCLFGLALSGIIFALLYARAGMAQQPHEGFTQFWIVPAGGNACAVKLGMHSFESGQTAYSVSVSANDVPISTQLPDTLKAGEQVEQTLELPTGVHGETVNVRARLYRLDRPGEVYRSVNIILHPRASSASACT